MATITSAGTGNWGDTGTWVGGVVPTSADAVIIAATHTVTLNVTGCACLSLTMNGTSTLTASTTVSTDLSISTVFTQNASASVDIDVSGNAAVVCKLILNVGGATGTGWDAKQNTNKISLKGASKKRWTQFNNGATLAAGSTSAIVLDATGWQIGDVVAFGSTTTGGAYYTSSEVVTLTSVSGNTIGWTGGTTYAYQDEGYVGNMSSNMIVKAFSKASQSVATRVVINVQSEPVTKPKFFSHVMFEGLGGSSTGGLRLDSQYWMSQSITGINDCAFYDSWSTALYPYIGLSDAPIDGCVFWTSKINSTASYNYHFQMQGSHTKPIKNCLFMKTSYGAIYGSLQFSLEDCVMVGVATGGFGGQFSKVTRLKAHCAGFQFGAIGLMDDCDFGGKFGETTLSHLYDIRTATNAVLKDSTHVATNILASYWVPSLSFIGAPDGATVTVLNKNRDVTLQEIWTPQSYTVPTYSRENTITKRSVSSFRVRPTRINTDSQRALSIPCGNTKSIRVVGYIRRDTATTAATVTISGLGITPVTYTASAAINQWEQFDLSATNNVAGYDGNLTLTYTANASVSTSSNVYFDGVPDSPFVTKCRHYGFLFDESLPTRTVNPVLTVSESTAYAYTGVTITGTQITVAAGTADTWAKVYAYSQAYYCLNLASDVLLTSTDGNNFAMPLATKLSWPAMGADGTLVGGWLLLTAGTHSYKLSGTKIDCTTVGAYDMAGTVFSGTVELVNSSGGAVTVSLPAGTAYTNTGPSITVTVAVDQADALITGIVAGSRLQIYNVTTATEMVNAINATSSYSLSYPTGTGYSDGDIVRVRLTYCSGLDAKLPWSTLTQATTAGWTVLANQLDDDVYISNSIDGSTCTEYTADYLNVQIDVSDPDAQTTIQRGYAWYCDQMTGDLGIAQYYGAMVAEDAFNYLLDTDVLDIKIQNTNMTTGVSLTGGALRRRDGSSPIAGGGSIYMYYGRTYGLETGVSGLTPTESDKLLAIPTTAAPSAASVASATRMELGAELAQIDEVWRIHGLDSGAPLTVTPASRTAGAITQAITGDGTTTTTLTREP